MDYLSFCKGQIEQHPSGGSLSGNDTARAIMNEAGVSKIYQRAAP